MDSVHLLFQNSGGFSALHLIEIWYLMGLNWGKQCLWEWEHLRPGFMTAKGGQKHLAFGLYFQNRSSIKTEAWNQLHSFINT